MQHAKLFNFRMSFCKILFDSKNQLNLKNYFGSFTKFSMQLKKFSLHVIHFNMQSKIGCF